MNLGPDGQPRNDERPPDGRARVGRMRPSVDAEHDQYGTLVEGADGLGGHHGRD
jgi:hypothetical protein